ncbi:MAG: sulfopyruvate decarboxylase subunit alpha, partial [Methanomassiliicoccaceae archaeon]|nr:sulfopyruvate decarboxylase subunit alpha [Methanomassiliicoccaceae archaeon]
MNEMTVVNILKDQKIDMIASLPCDRNKALTKVLPEHFRTVGLTREEDGVGICAGAYLAGGRPIMSIQSSGIGNMMNAMMSLTSVYGIPLP